MRVATVVALLAVGTCAQRGRAWEFAPIPLADVGERLDWTFVSGRPAWLQKPAGIVDQFSFTTRQFYGNAEGAKSRAAHNAKDDVRNVLFEHLLPALGSKATLDVVEAMMEKTALVGAAIGTDISNKGKESEIELDVACLCWRTPIRSIVERFEPEEQGRIESLFLRDVVHWQGVGEVPKWGSELPSRAGYFRCAFAHESWKPEIAREAAVSSACQNVHNHLLTLLTPAIGKQRAVAAADAGVARLGAVARVTLDRRQAKAGAVSDKVVAYSLWEVPLAPMLAKLPSLPRKVAMTVLAPGS